MGAVIDSALQRKADLATIHIAKAQLHLDEETYRGLLHTVGRVDSAADLDWTGRKKVIDHMRKLGFIETSRRRLDARAGRPHNVGAGERGAQLEKVEALLADAQRPWSYADAMAKRMFGRERVAFCDGAQLQRLIAALVYDQQRRARRETKEG